MPWSGGAFTRTNGVNTGATLWAQDRDDGTKILATRHDTNDQDMADGINSTLEKSGSNAATGNLNIGSNRLTAVADGTAKTDAATVNQIQSNAPAFQATDTGTANAHVIALSPAITAYAAGQRITFKSGAASTGASTLNVNTLGVKALKKLHDQDIASGDIESGSIVTAVYDGTNFQVTSQLASGAADAGAAYAGVLEANANFVDQVIFGPSVDGVPWNGAWSKASLFSSLMLCTVETAGSDTQVNIWDLTEESAGVISTTPLGTMTISGVTPTSVAAAMGYIGVGTDGGIKIVDPHSGAWTQRTSGWPKSCSTATQPPLTSSNIQSVAAGFSDQPPFDPRTGGPMPCFAVVYGAGADASALIKDDGNVYDKVIPSGSIGFKGVAIGGGRVLYNADEAGKNIVNRSPLISTITADDYTDTRAMRNDDYPYGFGGETELAMRGNDFVAASAEGVSFSQMPSTPNSAGDAINAIINRTFNSGFYTQNILGIWLANSPTVDRSPKANTLTANGSITQAVVESGCELLGYSGFSSSNYFSRAADADWASLANGNVHMSIWFKSSGNSAFETFMSARKASPPARIDIYLETNGTVGFECFGDAAETAAVSTGAFDDGVWHKLDGVQISNTERHVYVDGVLVGSNTTNAGSLTSADMILGIGARGHDAAVPATSSTLALAHFSATAPTATQVRQMYDAEKGMFVANAECLLQSGSTDAVLDVDVDPLSGKVLVTQTDAITIFDELVVDSKPTVNSGNSEKGKLWGDLRAEQNSANAYVTAPATDQRQVNEMVRGLASDLPAGVDLSKAKAWATYNSADVDIRASYNVKSITDRGTGAHTVNFATPFKNGEYACLGACRYASGDEGVTFSNTANTGGSAYVYVTRGSNGAYADPGNVYVVFFGELENE